MNEEKIKDGNAADWTPASYRVQIDETILSIEEPEPTGRFLMEKMGVEPTNHFLDMIIVGKDNIAVGPDDNIDLAVPGLERLQIVSREGHFLVRIDNQRYAFNQPEPTGRDLLTRVGKDPDRYRLDQILTSGEGKAIDPDELVDLRKPGIERFITVEKKPLPDCDSINVTIVTPIGKWDTAFHKTATISHVISSVLKKFTDIDATKQYVLQRASTDEILSPDKTLASYHIQDCEKLKFLPAQDGGGQ